MKGEGAIVFLIVFFVLLAATIASPSIPPGRDLYGLLGVPETDYPVLGVSTTILVSAIFNGVIYGIIVWLIFTIFRRTTKKKQPVKEKVDTQKDNKEEKTAT